METNLIFGNIVYIVIAFFLLKGALYMVKQKHAVIIERLGKFKQVSKAGLHFKIPLIDRIAGTVNLRVRELPVEVETKTKDDVENVIRLIYESLQKIKNNHDFRYLK